MTAAHMGKTHSHLQGVGRPSHVCQGVSQQDLDEKSQ